MRTFGAHVCARTGALAVVFGAGPGNVELLAWAVLFGLAAALLVAVPDAPRPRPRGLYAALGDPGRAR